MLIPMVLCIWRNKRTILAKFGALDKYRAFEMLNWNVVDICFMIHPLRLQKQNEWKTYAIYLILVPVIRLSKKNSKIHVRVFEFSRAKENVRSQKRLSIRCSYILTASNNSILCFLFIPSYLSQFSLFANIQFNMLQSINITTVHSNTIFRQGRGLRASLELLSSP